MTCRDFAEFVMDYLDGELPADRCAVFEGHLAECPDCVAYLQGYAQAAAMGKAAFSRPDDPVPADVPNDLVRAVLAARARQGLPGA